MIIDQIERLPFYFGISPLLKEVEKFLKGTDLDALANDRHVLIEDKLWVIIEEAGGKEELATLEHHQRFMDLQMCLKGEDRLGWKALENCQSIKMPYDKNRDIGFFNDKPDLWVPLSKRQFALVSPFDAHAPLGGKGTLRKMVFKIAFEMSSLSSRF